MRLSRIFLSISREACSHGQSRNTHGILDHLKKGDDLHQGTFKYLLEKYNTYSGTRKHSAFYNIIGDSKGNKIAKCGEKS